MFKSLLVGPLPPPIDGQSVAFKMLVEGFEERKYPFAVVNISPKSLVKNQGTFNLKRALEYGQIFGRFFFKLLKRNKVLYLTIAQSRVGFLRDLMMIFFAKVFRCRVICHIHGGNYDGFYEEQPRWLKKLISKTLRKVDKLIILGKGLETMFSFDPNLKAKINVVPNGLPSELQTLPKKGKALTGNEPVRLLFLSNLIESKGYLEVLEAVRILVDRYKLNVSCHFCGEFIQNVTDDKRVQSAEDGKKIFRDFVLKHGLETNVRYLGVVSGEKKVEELRAAHFFILPTNYRFEGQPISIIEAMAYGCVLISTRYRAIPDLLQEGQNGYFVDYGDANGIAEHIRDLVSDPQRYHRMSNASIQIYQSKFTRNAYLEKLMKVILE